MIKLKKVLCPIDFSKYSEFALKQAINVASNIADELHIFHAILLYEDNFYKPDDRLPDNIISIDLIEEISHQKLEELSSRHFTQKLKIITASSRGFSAAEEILSYAEKNQINLIIMGSHGRTAIAHFLLGSVAERVVQMAKCPVMTVRKAIDNFPHYRKILVPIDFSEYAKLALKYALEIANSFNFKVTLFHSFEQQIHPAFYSLGKESIFEIDRDLKDRASKAIEEFRNESGYPDIKTDYIFAEGVAYHEIIEHIKQENYDLLVMGSHGLKGLEHFLIGSTTEKVIRQAEVPVLVVKKSNN